MPEPLSIERLNHLREASLCGQFGQPVEYHPQIGSTNDRLRTLANDGAPQGTLVITDEQIAGRGRLGRRWHAPPNTAVLMSVLFRPALPPAQANRLVMCCGLAIRDAAKPLDIEVKWPNDLLIGGKKVAGILPESAVMGGDLQYVIVGMGININTHFEPGSPLYDKATSLSHAQGTPFDREKFIVSVLHHINRRYAQLHQPTLHREWQAACSTITQRISVQTSSSGVLTGTAESITPEGRLNLRTDDGTLHTLSLSEATVIPPQTP